MPSGIYAISNLIASVFAADHYSFFSDEPTDIKGMYTQRLCRSFGLAAHLGWDRLPADRYRDLIEIPAPTRQSPDGQRNFNPGDEDASEYETCHNPDSHSNKNKPHRGAFLFYSTKTQAPFGGADKKIRENQPP